MAVVVCDLWSYTCMYRAFPLVRGKHKQVWQEKCRRGTMVSFFSAGAGYEEALVRYLSCASDGSGISTLAVNSVLEKSSCRLFITVVLQHGS